MFKSENNQITIEQMRKLDEEYTLVDIRDEISFEYGHIDGAKNIPLAKIKEDNSLLPKDKLVVLCCKSGQISDELAENLRDDGFNAVNLEGGYYSWLRSQFENEDYATDVEKSIRKKFSKTIWSRFTAAIIEYKLVEPNDKIAVCISGGKDSMLMAKLFQELKRHNKFPFELVFLVMDPGYSVENRDVIESNARRLNIPITVFETDVFKDVCFGPKNLGLDRKETELRAYKALKMVGLPDEYFYQSPFDLSGGQKRRVAIAGVLAMEPDVLILDEPTAGLDPKGRDEILELIKGLQETGMTIILVSHSMEDVANYVDRIIVMNKGSVMLDGVPKDVFAHYKELEEVGLAAPAVTYIMQQLKQNGFAVSTDATTIEEAKEEILRALHRAD